jgi:hypothetical protein
MTRPEEIQLREVYVTTELFKARMLLCHLRLEQS